MADEVYSNIRDVLAEAIGKRILDITQHDKDEYADTKQSYVMIMLEDGIFMKFPIGDEGFDHNAMSSDEMKEQGQGQGEGK